MSSLRLPGKVLMSVNNKLLLEYIIERLDSYDKIEDIIIATSTNKEDDVIADYCKVNKINIYRGMLNDVAGRMLQAAKTNNHSSFIRINGDSPFIDTEIVARALSLFKYGNYDLVTNTYPRSYPIGQSVEVIKTSTFEGAYKNMTKPDEFEHVTKYFYNHTNDFKIHNFKNVTDLSHYRLAVDTTEDMKRFQKIIDRMDKPHTEYDMNEIIALFPSSLFN